MATIKISYNSSIRRFTIPTSTTWFEFERKIRSLFSIPELTPITVAYKDYDGDTITISSDLELGEVLSSASGGNLVFTLSTNEDDNKNSWVLEGDSMEPYRISEAETVNVTKEVVKENSVIEEELPADQNSGEITKEPLKEKEVETQTETSHLRTTVTNETDDPLFEPTIANDKKEETQSRNELLDDPSTSSGPSVTVEKGQTGLDSSTSEARNPKNGPEPVENTNTIDLWEELLKSLLEDTPRRETLPENLGESSSTSVNPRLVIRVAPPPYSRQTYGPCVAGFGGPRCGSSFARAALLNNAQQYQNNCGYTNTPRQCQSQCNYQFGPRTFYNHHHHPLSKFISTIISLFATIVIVKAAFCALGLLFHIALFAVPILFLAKLHNKFYVRREHFGNRGIGNVFGNHSSGRGTRYFPSRSVFFARP